MKKPYRTLALAAVAIGVAGAAFASHPVITTDWINETPTTLGGTVNWAATSPDSISVVNSKIVVDTAVPATIDATSGAVGTPKTAIAGMATSTFTTTFRAAAANATAPSASGSIAGITIVPNDTGYKFQFAVNGAWQNGYSVVPALLDTDYTLKVVVTYGDSPDITYYLNAAGETETEVLSDVLSMEPAPTTLSKVQAIGYGEFASINAGYSKTELEVRDVSGAEYDSINDALALGTGPFTLLGNVALTNTVPSGIYAINLNGKTFDTGAFGGDYKFATDGDYVSYTFTTDKFVARLGDSAGEGNTNMYYTVRDAYLAIANSDPVTIHLLSNASGEGFDTDPKEVRNITIDLHNFTNTFSGAKPFRAYQKGSSMTIQNGTLNCTDTYSGSDMARTYAGSYTLNNVVVDCENIGKTKAGDYSAITYTDGDLILTGTTKIINVSNVKYAIDMGNYAGNNATEYEMGKLTIDLSAGGEINGDMNFGGGQIDIRTTDLVKSAHFYYCSMEWSNYEDSDDINGLFAARNGSIPAQHHGTSGEVTFGGELFKSLSAALAAVGTDAYTKNITLAQNVTDATADIVIPSDVTFDLNEKTLAVKSFTNNGTVIVYNQAAAEAALATVNGVAKAGTVLELGGMIFQKGMTVTYTGDDTSVAGYPVAQFSVDAGSDTFTNNTGIATSRKAYTITGAAALKGAIAAGEGGAKTKFAASTINIIGNLTVNDGAEVVSTGAITFETGCKITLAGNATVKTTSELVIADCFEGSVTSEKSGDVYTYSVQQETPIVPGGSKTVDSEAEAAKVTMETNSIAVAVPGINTANYAALFTKKVTPTSDGKYQVEFVLTEEAGTAITNTVENATAAIDVSAIAASPSTASSVTFIGTPGIFYAVNYGESLGGMTLDVQNEKQAAADGSVTITLPTPDSSATSGFYNVEAYIQSQKVGE